MNRHLQSVLELLSSPDPQTAQELKVDSLQLNRQSVVDKNLLLCRFSHLGCKETRFERCVFNHSFFDSCYFRKATFRSVSFVGCTFRDCRFGEAAFGDCKFDEAEFENCSITFEQIASTLPTRQNVLWRVARSLRVNAEARGQSEDARKFLRIELKASETHNFKKAFAWGDPFYSKKYSLEDRILGFGKWLLSKASDFLWGYGEFPLRVIRFSALIVLLFAFCFFRFGNLKNMPEGAGFWEYFGYSVATLATASYGDVIPATRTARLLATAESTLGLIMFGFFVSALYRRISKR